MAVLNKVDMGQVSGVNAAQILAIRALIAHEFWAWFEEHKEDTILKKKILFVSLHVKVKSAKFIFEALLGPNPGD